MLFTPFIITIIFFLRRFFAPLKLKAIHVIKGPLIKLINYQICTKDTSEAKLELNIVGLYPVGSPSRNSRRPGLDPGLRGGLEIVFNQQ